MNNLKRIFVWISRMGHCRGFGIQSPTDYQFVRHVVNQHWPYYAYSEIGKDDDWLKRKLGRLYFRLANWRQPDTIVDAVGAGEYLRAGCRKARFVDHCDTVQMACVPIACDYQTLFSHCDSQSVVIFQDIWKQMPLWHSIEHDERVTVCYDLYYCGIVFFDKKRAKQCYTVNF